MKCLSQGIFLERASSSFGLIQRHRTNEVSHSIWVVDLQNNSFTYSSRWGSWARKKFPVANRNYERLELYLSRQFLGLRDSYRVYKIANRTQFYLYLWNFKFWWQRGLLDKIAADYCSHRLGRYKRRSDIITLANQFKNW